MQVLVSLRTPKSDNVSKTLETALGFVNGDASSKLVILCVDDEFNNGGLCREEIEKYITEKLSTLSVPYSIKFRRSIVPELTIASEIDKGTYDKVVVGYTKSFFEKVLKFDTSRVIKNIVSERNKIMDIHMVE